MGQKNAVTKRYYSDKTRFADLINGVYFQGQEVIHPNELTESSEIYATPLESNPNEQNRHYAERYRDIKMCHQTGVSIRIFAIENQHYIDYSMPFRLYCVNEEQNFSMFHTEIRNVFELLPLRKDKKRLLQKLEQNSTYKHMSEDSLELLSVLMDSPSIWKNRKKYMVPNDVNQETTNPESEEYNMCQAIRELIEDGRQEGLSQGLTQGLSQGRIETLTQNVKSLMNSLSISLEKACELLNCTKDYDVLSGLIQK